MDHWKGSLIRFLCQEGLIYDLAVEPMITDHEDWSPDDLETYQRLLNLTPGVRICHEGRAFGGSREVYFKDIRHIGDLFIDPDTGISTGACSRKHIKISEIRQLLYSTPRRSRVLMVYQHSARGQFHSRLLQIRDSLVTSIPDLRYCIYESGRVAMCFLSLNERRIRSLEAGLRHFLTGTAMRRIWGM